MLHVVMVASEMVPYAKTGGLGDVLGALPAALASLGHRVSVVLPRYGSIDPGSWGIERLNVAVRVALGGVVHQAELYRHERDDGVTVYFLDAPALYHRRGLYGTNGQDHPDNDVRFGLLSRGAIEVARVLRLHVDVFHAHDWQASLVPWVLRNELGAFFPSVLTVHNLGYPGLFPAHALHTLGIGSQHFNPAGVEFHGAVNLLKAGLLTAQKITTVSETYAREIRTAEHGWGMEGVLRARGADLVGILNGVDYKVWDPSTDPHVPSRYSAADLEGKRQCKAELRRALSLPDDDVPIIGMVSRLDRQKGFDLILKEAPHWLATGKVQLAVLGTGSPDIEGALAYLASRFPTRVSVMLRYDERMAHAIEAGSDIYLMPSLYEPCGLNQIYSLRYGTIPVVRATGGLNDTVREADLERDTGTGFKFLDYAGPALTSAMERAVAAYADRDAWTRLMRRAMAEDFSWDRSARLYSALYDAVC